MITKNIAEMTARIDTHRAADLLVQGTYYEASTGKGCFIGCLAHGNRPEVLEETYGIPVSLTRVLERIFESLSSDEAADFFTAIPRAIGTDGKDLSRVVWAFLGETLRAMPTQEPKIQAVIDPVIAGMDLLAAGKDWPQAAWAVADATRVVDVDGAEGQAVWAAAAARAAAWAAVGGTEYSAGAAGRLAAARASEDTEYAVEGRAARRAAEVDRQRDSVLRLMSEAQQKEKSK